MIRRKSSEHDIMKFKDLQLPELLLFRNFNYLDKNWNMYYFEIIVNYVKSLYCPAIDAYF